MTSENIITTRGLYMAETLLVMGETPTLSILKDEDIEDGTYYVLNARSKSGSHTALGVYYKREEAEEMKRYIERCFLPVLDEIMKRMQAADKTNDLHQ